MCSRSYAGSGYLSCFFRWLLYVLQLFFPGPYDSILTPMNHIGVYLCSGVLRLAGRDGRCVKCILTKKPALMSETNIRGNIWFVSSCTCRKKRCCSTPGKECPQQRLPEIVRVWVQVQGQCQGCWFPPLRDQLMLCDPGILPELLLPHEHRAECLVR